MPTGHRAGPLRRGRDRDPPLPLMTSIGDVSVSLGSGAAGNVGKQVTLPVEGGHVEQRSAGTSARFPRGQIGLWADAVGLTVSPLLDTEPELAEFRIVGVAATDLHQVGQTELGIERQVPLDGPPMLDRHRRIPPARGRSRCWCKRRPPCRMSSRRDRT